jgi:hypothetical protein
MWTTLLALMVLGVLLLALSSGPAEAATTFTVNKTGDAGDRRINDSVCDSSRKNGKQCTLRAAIQESNDTENFADPDTINFNIGGTASVKIIKPASPLPDITDPVTIDGYTQPGASANTLAEGNDAVLKIALNGTDAGPAHGLAIQAADSTIKGLVINRFVGNGVSITGSGATGNKVLGNFVGTNASGTEALGNGGEGVEIFDTSDNTVGGAREAARNLISGNTDDGVEFQGATLGNEILGNYIGTNASGTEPLGNGGDGVHILGEGNTVGGTVSGARNVISGNGGDGVDFQGVNTKDNKVEGNFIGTQASGTQDLGNGIHGVDFRDGADDNTVGGTVSGAGNRIAHNGQDGVSISSGTGNSVLSNFIFSNGGTSATTNLGIDLGASGVTANDTGDADPGANNLQNFPEIDSAIKSNTNPFPGATTITGELNSKPSQSFTIQFFVAAPDPSGHGEGLPLLGQTTVTDDNGDGDVSFTLICPSTACPFALSVGQTVTATATNMSGTVTGTAIGDTSEFSQNVGVVPG